MHFNNNLEGGGDVAECTYHATNDLYILLYYIILHIEKFVMILHDKELSCYILCFIGWQADQKRFTFVFEVPQQICNITLHCSKSITGREWELKPWGPSGVLLGLASDNPF